MEKQQVRKAALEVLKKYGFKITKDSISDNGVHPLDVIAAQDEIEDLIFEESKVFQLRFTEGNFLTLVEYEI
jgi:uncharacterized protein with von Willebrand factor type A (vWA) domain